MTDHCPSHCDESSTDFDLRIETALAKAIQKHHVCIFEDKDAATIKEFAEFWRKNETSMKNIARVWNTSSSTIINTIVLGVMAMITWIIYLAITHGLWPAGKN